SGGVGPCPVGQVLWSRRPSGAVARGRIGWSPSGWSQAPQVVMSGPAPAGGGGSSGGGPASADPGEGGSAAAGGVAVAVAADTCSATQAAASSCRAANRVSGRP